MLKPAMCTFRAKFSPETFQRPWDTGEARSGEAG